MDDYGLTVEIRGEPGHVLITVAGEVDIATVPQLQERLAASAASGQPLIVDLDLLTFIHAAGLGVLASAASRAAAHGASLHAVCARHQVRRLFTIAGLDRQIPLARTMTQACHNLAAAGDPGQRPPPACRKSPGRVGADWCRGQPCRAPRRNASAGPWSRMPGQAAALCHLRWQMAQRRGSR